MVNLYSNSVLTAVIIKHVNHVCVIQWRHTEEQTLFLLCAVKRNILFSIYILDKTDERLLLIFYSLILSGLWMKPKIYSHYKIQMS